MLWSIVGARQTTHPRVVVNRPCYRDTVTLGHRENPENHIETLQRPRSWSVYQGRWGRTAARPGFPGLPPAPPRWQRLGFGPTKVIWSSGRLGEWRNGRRAGFRCQCPSGRGGSSPPSPTASGSMNRRRNGHELERGRDLCVCVDRCSECAGSTAMGSGLATPQKATQLLGPGVPR